MNYSKNGICDYTTLYLNDGVHISTKEINFTIPNTIYKNAYNHDYISITLVECLINKNHGAPFIIHLKNITNINNRTYVLGNLTNLSNAGDYKRFFIAKNNPHLISRNDFEKIRLVLTNASDTPISFKNDTGFFTLKFDYYSKDNIKEENASMAFERAF